MFAQSVILLVAGFNTSAMTMSYTLVELAKNPEIQAKVHQELREKLSTGGLTYESVSDLTYLQQVIDETLRLYPPAPLIDRIAMEKYKVSVFKIGTSRKKSRIFRPRRDSKIRVFLPLYCRRKIMFCPWPLKKEFPKSHVNCNPRRSQAILYFCGLG